MNVGHDSYHLFPNICSWDYKIVVQKREKIGFVLFGNHIATLIVDV